MQHSPSTPKKKGSESGAAASSASESSPSRNTLFVPPPEQPWTGAALARALATTNTGTHVDVADKNNVAATTLFSFPYTFPSVSQGDGAARKLPPLSSLLQLPTHTSGADSVALYPAAPLAPQPYDNGTSEEVGGRGDGLATTALAAAPLPLGHSSKSSWPTPSVSGATQAGATAAADSQGHSFSSVSSATTTTTLISDTNTDAASAGATADRSDAATTTPPTAQITVAAAACSSSLAMSAARSPPQQSSQAASSFTDLFVGLERPRLHRGPRCEEARASVLSCEGASATSHLFSLIQCSNSLEASSHDEVEEDEGGAHTPTVYRSTRLPHWWRSIVTPSIGTRVCLRPNTPRLEFWWIDRLGSEAYELMQVILKHSLEGVVTRESAESVVVVEFTIPAAYLDTTSFAVWPDSAATDVARAAAAGAANDSATVVAAAHVNDGGGAAACTPPAWEAAEDGERTLDGTACTTAPPFDSNEGTVAPSPVGSAHAAATTPRLSATAASTMTVGRTTGTPSTTFSEAPPSAVFAGLPVLVGADSPRHDDAVDSGLHHALAINSAAAAAAAASAVVPAAASNASTPTITALQSMATSVFTDSKANGGVAAPPRDLTSVPSLRRSDSDSTASPSSPQRLLSSFSLDVVPGHTSLSTVERSGSVVTVAGRHSDPFAAERRLHNEPSLTRILKTSPHEKPFPTTAAQQMQRLQPPGSGRNAMLRTPVTPGERGYSPDPSEDTANDTSAKDSNTAEHDSAEAAAVPLVPRQQQQQQEERTGSANSRDNDHSLVHVEPVPKYDDGSLCLLNSVESPFRWPSPSSHPYRLPSPRHSSYAHVTVYPDGCQPSKTYGEWLRTTHTTSSLGGSANGTSGLVAAAAPWSHDSPEETTNFLGRITSSSDNDDTTSAAAAAAKRTGNCHHRGDDDVLVRLSLPSSVCIPVVAVRLHALGLLHPFLDAITIPYDMPSFNTDSNDDDDDDDGMGGALRTATQASPFTSELVEQTATPDYNTAVQLISAAITRAEQARQMSIAAGATADAKEEGPAASDAPPPLPTAPRDLSILYTVRSHLHFHMSPEFLFDSLKDAEMALACCPTHEHVCHTYEVLTACLISFGHTAQVERVAAHLRHRCRTPTPLLTRLGRVTQVMVSYGTLFLRQQLNPALLRCAAATAREGGKRASAPVLLCDGVQSSPLDGAAYLSRAQLPPPPSASSASSAAAQAAALVAASADGASLVVSTTAMPLVVVGGGIVDPPAGWDGGQQQQQQARHSTTTIATTTTTASGAVVHAAQTATALAPRTLPYEVCPLLLGYYGKSLHRSNDVPRHPYPPPLSPHSSACHPAAQRHRHYMSRPSSDVCHRRLFLLETLFPSVMPLTAMNRLQQVFSMPRPKLHRGSVGARGFQAMRHSLCKGGTDTAETGAVVATAKAEKKIKAEDFMYDRDSMFALLATSSETAIPYGTVSMRYFGRHIRLSATRRIPKGETVLLERPALMLALWPLPPPRASCTTSGGPWRMPSSAALPRAAPAYCAQCGRQPLSHPVRCPGDCGSHYCSEGCRCEALRLYHVMECCCGGGGGGSGAPGRDAGSSTNSNDDDDDDARVRRAVAALHPIFAEWEAFIYHFANWNTPSTRSATPVASCTPSVSASLSSTPPEPTPDPPAAAPPPAEKKSPPPVLAAAGLRAMARLVAMILGLVLPVERLPQWQQAGRTAATVASWAEKRHANFRAVARTLHGRGLLVPAGSGRAANLYCTGVDPHRLLLLEVLLQQLSVPFFADFTYRAPSTVWEAMEQFPCAVQHGVSAATTAGRNTPPDDEAGTPPSSASRLASNTLGAPLIIPFTARATRPPPTPGRRHWTVELTMAQRQELMVTIHALLQRIHAILSAELAAVSVLPPTAPAQRGDEAAAAGAPGLWRCAALLGFLPSTRVFEELFDFCLTSCAVVYPKNAEPEAVGGLGSSESGSPAPSTHSRASAAATAAVPAADRKTSDSAASASAPPAVPMAVISPWTCLTVDLLPILGHSPGGVIYSRFMVEHEQRRRMIAYCAAAATRHGAGGGSGGSSGYGSGVENDSFLSIHSMASASAAAVLGGSANSPANDDLGRSGTLKEDWSLKMLEEAASRSCANLHLSLVHSPLPTEAGRPSMVAVVMTTKKSVQLGDVLWWESLNFGEYLHALF